MAEQVVPAREAQVQPHTPTTLADAAPAQSLKEQRWDEQAGIRADAH